MHFGTRISFSSQIRKFDHTGFLENTHRVRPTLMIISEDVESRLVIPNTIRETRRECQ